MLNQDVKSLVDKGIALSRQKQNKRAIAVFDDVVARFGAARELATRKLVAEALFEKAMAFDVSDMVVFTKREKREYRGRCKERIAILDDMIARFGAAREPKLRKWVAIALVLKGAALNGLHRYEAAVLVFDKVVSRFAPDKALRIDVARALVMKGLTFGIMKKPRKAIAAYDDVIARFGTVREPQVRNEIGKALIDKCRKLSMLDRNLEAVEACDGAIAHFTAAGKVAPRSNISVALLGKCKALIALERYKDAVAVCDTMVARFGRDATMIEMVVQAILAKGVAFEGLGRNPAALATYGKVIAKCGEAWYLVEWAVRARMGTARMFAQMGRSQDAIAVSSGVVRFYDPAKYSTFKRLAAEAMKLITSEQASQNRNRRPAR